MTVPANDALTTPWAVVLPEHSDGGVTIWTRGRYPNRRVLWLKHTEDNVVLAEHIVVLHNMSHAVKVGR